MLLILAGSLTSRLLLLLLLLAGFGVNLQVILAHPRAQFNRRVGGMQEPDFLKQITKVTDLEPKANNCTRVSTLPQSPSPLPTPHPSSSPFRRSRGHMTEDLSVVKSG